MIFVTRENKVLNIYTQRSSSPLLTLFKLFQPMLQEASLKSSANNHRLVLVLGIKKKKKQDKKTTRIHIQHTEPLFPTQTGIKVVPRLPAPGLPPLSLSPLFAEQAPYPGRCGASLPGPRA